MKTEKQTEEKNEVRAIKMYSPLLPPSPAALGYPEMVAGLRFPFYPMAGGRLTGYPDIMRSVAAGHRGAAPGGLADSWARIPTAKDPNIQVFKEGI